MKLKSILIVVALTPPFVIGAENEFYISIKDHRFIPTELHIPAGQKVKLIIDNQDVTPEEFESHELNREKIIAPKSKSSLYVGPLKPGSYPFFGEFNPSTARGVLIAQ